MIKYYNKNLTMKIIVMIYIYIILDYIQKNSRFFFQCSQNFSDNTCYSYFGRFNFCKNTKTDKIILYID